MRTLFASAVGLALFLVSLPVTGQQSTVSTVEPNTVYVDYNCRVLTATHPSKANPAPPPRYRRNSVVCHIDYSNQSVHRKKATIKGVQKTVYVTVNEREYLLQNTADQSVTFVVDYLLRKGWQVDSDPQPDEVKGSVATFRVIAQPGQIVRLHVGSHS